MSKGPNGASLYVTSTRSPCYFYVIYVVSEAVHTGHRHAELPTISTALYCL